MEEMKMNKKFLSLILALALSASLTACGSSDTTETTDDADSGDTAETVTLKVAASPTPHAEILEQVKPILAEQGIDLVITEYGDYIVPNTAVDEGDEDANYFQHTPYLEQFNEENGTDLVSAGKIHYEPMGIYAGKTASLEELPDGATIAVPNDATNEARALQLLAAQGLIEIDPEAGLNATPNDITSNPKNLEFTELDAAMIPNTIEEFDLNVINSNYALQAGLNPAEDALASEDAASDAAQTYANIVAVKAGHENDPAIVALVDALHSEEIQEFINTTYAGSVLPID
jgi:D-methionine transport system substrate-binding protein